MWTHSAVFYVFFDDGKWQRCLVCTVVFMSSMITSDITSQQ